jgi:signal transduction protein with GAF and PtsI domain
MARTAEQVRKELDAERERLAGAVDELRASIGRTAKKTVPVAAGATAFMGVARHFARRRRR